MAVLKERFAQGASRKARIEDRYASGGRLQGHLSVLFFRKCSNLTGFCYHYWVTFKKRGDFPRQLRCYLYDIYLYAGLSIAKSLTCAHHAGYGHQLTGVFFEDLLDWPCCHILLVSTMFNAFLCADNSITGQEDYECGNG